MLKLQIWDTAGEELYRAMTRSFFRDAKVGVIVYDITEPKSFKSVTTYWVKEFREACPESLVIVLGNKADLEDQRRVATEAGEDYCKSVGAHFFEVSAKTGKSIAQVFEFAANEYAKSRVR